MKRSASAAFVMMAVLFCAVAAPGWGQSEEEIAKMEAAMPDKARVEPAQPRKLLVFNLCRGFVHSSIPYAAKALEIMGQKTGAFEAVSSDDIAMFEPENLSQFDAVCMNNTTGELFVPKGYGDMTQEEQEASREYADKLKASLLDFVRSGKGIVGIHAATDCWYQWAEYGELMGGYFHGHPWNEDVAVKIDDPAHPLSRVFQGRKFVVADEIYQFKDPYSREKLRVLLSLDTAHTDMTKDSIHRTDDDFAVSWIRDYGKGRVFYCSLGHRHDIFWNPMLLEYYRDGIQYALGDLEADATPSSKLSNAYLDESLAFGAQVALSGALGEAVKFDYGQPRDALRAIMEMVTESGGSPQQRQALADALAEGLSAEAATLQGKQFLCKQLSRIATESNVPALAPLLQNEDTCDMARFALGRIPGPAADKALLGALDTTTGALKAGIINTLADRGCREAVGALAGLMQDADETIARAATIALGKIGGPKAEKALKQAIEKVDDFAWGPAALNDAYLRIADQLAAEGKNEKALEIYYHFMSSVFKEAHRMAALQGILEVGGPDAAFIALDFLESGATTGYGAVAMAAVPDIPGDEATEMFARGIPGLAPWVQPFMIDALARRGDKAAAPAVAKAIDSEFEDVRKAALKALGALGDASTVPLLAKAAAGGEDVARASLAKLTGDGIDEAIVDLLGKAEPDVQRVLAESLAARNATQTVPVLLKVAAEGAEPVRVEACKALGIMASGDSLEPLVTLLLAAPSEAVTQAAADAVVALAARADDASRQAALGTLSAAAKSGTGRAAAMKSLAQWPTDAAAAPLLEVAATGTDAERVAALEGALERLSLNSERPTDDTLAGFTTALSVAKTMDEKKAVIEALGDLRDKRAIALVEPLLGQAELAAVAKEALDKLSKIAFVASASHGENEAANAIDGNEETRWSTGGAMKPGMWFMLDMGLAAKVKKITLDTRQSGSDYPRGYEVYVSSDPDNMGEPVATGEGNGPVTEISFEPKTGRYIKIVQTGSTETWFWSIHEIQVETE